MSCKHFELFATMLSHIPSVALRLKFAEELIKVLLASNSRFNESRFRQAANCTINAKGEWVEMNDGP